MEEMAAVTLTSLITMTHAAERMWPPEAVYWFTLLVKQAEQEQTETDYFLQFPGL